MIVGGSLAGCATAILLGRAGARVALVEKQPDPEAFKRICSHFIQASGVPTIERLGLLEPIDAAGGVRSRIHAWTEWGWIEAAARARRARGLNLRREVLDPMRARGGGADARRRAAARAGPSSGCVRDGGAVRGVVGARPRRRRDDAARASSSVGADGRDSHVAELAGVTEKAYPHGRFAYGGYFEGGAPTHAPDASIWMMDPQWAAAFPTDSGLTFYAAMPTKDRLPEFKRDPTEALVTFVADLPEPPPIRDGARWSNR